MLKRIHRLSSVRLKNAINVKGEFISFKYSSNDLEYPRFAFVISKKIDSRSVVRNKLKRKLSLSIEEIFDRIEIGNDIVIFPGKITLEKSQQDITREIISVFKRKNLIK